MDDFEVITWFSKGNGGGYSEKLMKGVTRVLPSLKGRGIR